MSGDPDALSAASKKKSIIVVEFWATWDKTSKLTFNLLSQTQSELPVDDVVFAQISKESEKTVRNFIAALPVKPRCSVFVDPGSEVSDEFMGKAAGIPQVFIIEGDGRVLWKGEVVDLRYVLGKVVAGDFDFATQSKVIPLRKSLQQSMQLGKFIDAKRVADEILKTDPADELAARVELFLFEREKRLKNAIPFINSLLSRSPKTPFLHLLKLDTLNLTNASPKEIRTTAEKAFAAFGDNHAALNRLASLLVDRLRFGTAPIDVAVRASSKAVDLFFAKRSNNSDRLATYLQTRAKAYYLSGRFDDAVESQEKSAKLLLGGVREKRAAELLEYYRAVKSSAKCKPNI